MDELELQALRALREALQAGGVACDLAGSALVLRTRPETSLYIAQHALEHRSSPLRDSTIVTLTISLAFSWGGQRHVADSQIGGLGDTIAEALGEAAATWASCMAPPLLSALTAAPAPGQEGAESPSAPADGAELIPAGDPDGLQEWHVYASPYVINDDVDEATLEPVVAHLEREPLLASLSAQLQPALDASRPFSTVALLRAQSGDWVRAECLVDAVPHEALGAALAALPWPVVPASAHLSLRLFLACLPAE